jgi:hypothetical protein
MERLECILPTTTVDQIVPFRDQVDDGTAVVALAKGHATIHAPATLVSKLVF